MEFNYSLPDVSNDIVTLLEHCHRAINYARRFDGQSCPVMSYGDWNFGMNLVGTGGIGESV